MVNKTSETIHIHCSNIRTNVQFYEGGLTVRLTKPGLTLKTKLVIGQSSETDASVTNHKSLL